MAASGVVKTIFDQILDELRQTILSLDAEFHQRLLTADINREACQIWTQRRCQGAV